MLMINIIINNTIVIIAAAIAVVAVTLSITTINPYAANIANNTFNS